MRRESQLTVLVYILDAQAAPESLGGTAKALKAVLQELVPPDGDKTRSINAAQVHANVPVGARCQRRCCIGLCCRLSLGNKLTLQQLDTILWEGRPGAQSLGGGWAGGCSRAAAA